MPTRARSRSSGLMSSRISPAAMARSSSPPTARVSRSNEEENEFRVFVGGKRERRRHALFRGNELHIRAHPVPERLDRLHLLFQLFGQIGKMLHFAAIHRFEQGFARGEMPVERADADAGGSRDGFEARIRTAGAEHRFCRLEHALAVANRIGARLSHAFSRSFMPSVESRPLENGGILRIFVQDTLTHNTSVEQMPMNPSPPSRRASSRLWITQFRASAHDRQPRIDKHNCRSADYSPSLLRSIA